MAKRQKISVRDFSDEYDDFEDAYYEKRSAKPKPKKASAGLIHGVVTRARGHHFDVRVTTAQGGRQMRLCEVRGRLRQEKNRDTLIAVGDRVWVRPEGEDKGLIETVDERQSVLSRQRAGVTIPAEDVILANPDQLLAVFSIRDPEPHLRMVDRFLVIAEANELPAIICVNKIDLTGVDFARQVFGLYEEIGYPVIYASATTTAGIQELGKLLTDRITVVAGPSGVGKSSLINAIHPDLHLETGELRDFMSKGKHTTRAAHLLPLPFGEETYIADTPGIRELGLYDIDPEELGFYFKEFESYINQCRYPDCTHDHEPGCAVRAALEAGHIHPQRYASYLRLLHGEEE